MLFIFPLPGEMILQFDEHFFLMGWNPQLGISWFIDQIDMNHKQSEIIQVFHPKKKIYIHNTVLKRCSKEIP